jgi:hypothetical protein
MNYCCYYHYCYKMQSQNYHNGLCNMAVSHFYYYTVYEFKNIINYRTIVQNISNNKMCFKSKF